MENRDLIEKVIAKLKENPELLKTVGELTLEPEDYEMADRQKSDTVYVLTGKIKVKSDSEEEKYHYHPIIADCFLNPDATENKMICSDNLLELQRMQKKLPLGLGAGTVILAVSREVFDKLQGLLDKTIAELLAGIRHITDLLVNENQSKLPKGALQFDEIFYAVTSYIMTRSDTLIGSALTEDSTIVESIGDVEYDNPLLDYHCDCCDENGCDGDDDCCCDCEEDDNDCEYDDEPEIRHRIFFGSID